MNERHKLAGMRALVDSRKSNSHYLEELDGSYRLWSDLSPQSKLEYIARDAAFYEASFESFAAVVRESIDKSALETAALRLLLRGVSELRDLEKLFPDDGRTESPPPLAERVADLLFGTEFSKTEFERIVSEQRDDASQRPLHEKGVRYEDEPIRLEDLRRDKVKESARALTNENKAASKDLER